MVIFQIHVVGVASLKEEGHPPVGPYRHGPRALTIALQAGLNSIGLQSAGGGGKMIFERIRDGHPPNDLWEVDVRRNMPFQINRKYLRERVCESLGLLYATHWPFRQYATARGARKSALHDRLAAAGACFGEAFGWERANWYAPAGTLPPGVRPQY